MSLSGVKMGTLILSHLAKTLQSILPVWRFCNVSRSDVADHAREILHSVRTILPAYDVSKSPWEAMTGKSSEIMVEVLEAFRRAIKVNAYDDKRVADSLYWSKHFLTHVAAILIALGLLESKKGKWTRSLCLLIICRPILHLKNGDCTGNELVDKGLAIRVLSIVMQNPGILESCRKLLEIKIMDNHVIIHKMHQTTSAQSRAILSVLHQFCVKRQKSICMESISTKIP
ncbi:unnamed protein product [Fraxinus pennsylvanica]|uniref:Uncharacterized protein n=1 Tax=Fraxinus pennsylvanica TaxID=56036 RepID=A0AAD1YX37_9LAMI|nr:unnamed protein product [Fraxinus pennsylvanica]